MHLIPWRLHGRKARWRLVLAGASSLFVALSVFSGTSLALRSNTTPTIRDNLAVAALPTSRLSGSDALSVNNLIGAGQLLDRVGITTQSYENARKIAQTLNGPLYFIPGSHGACLAIPREAVACGDPGARQQKVLVLAGYNARTGLFSGAGVARNDVRRISLSTGGVDRVLPLHQGVFTLTRPISPHTFRGLNVNGQSRTQLMRGERHALQP